MRYQVELMWNREFNFVPFGDPHKTLKSAIKYARDTENMGDGERVKKTRIVDGTDGSVVWEYGKKVDKSVLRRARLFRRMYRLPKNDPFWHNDVMFTKPVLLRESKNGEDLHGFWAWAEKQPLRVRNVIESCPK